MIKKMEFFLFVFLVLFIPHLLFGQTTKTTSFFPGTPTEDKTDSEINSEMASFKNSRLYGSLLQYLAVKNEDLSICNNEMCDKGTAKEMIAMRYLGEKRCGDMKDSKFKDICFAYSNPSFNISDPSSVAFYNALLKEDLPAIINSAFIMIQSSADSRSFKKEITQDVSIILGFKYHDVNSCQRFSKELGLSAKLGCNVLFSSDPDGYLDQIARFLAIANVSKRNNNPNLCEAINNTDIKNYCKDPKKKDLADIW